jgi:O-antigen/teichoic acid export membrane protein
MQIPFAAIASIGGVLFIWLGPRSVVALISWQASVSILHLGVMYLYFRSHIGVPLKGARPRIAMLRKHWRFSLGMSAISITGMILMHLDKILLSRLLPLQIFGHYSLAVTLARGLYTVITPVFNAYFPRLSTIVASRDEESLRASYHAATQVMATLLLPLAVTIVFFSGEVLLLWLRDVHLAAAVAPLATLLVIGTCLNGLMNVPFALQLARGNTRLGLAINVFLVVLLVPSTVFATTHYGAIGGAAMWATLNGLYLLVGLPITHKYVLGGGLKNWACQDILPPLCVSLVVVGLGRFLLPVNAGNSVGTLAWLVLLWWIATAAACLSAVQVRQRIVEALRDLARRGTT